MDDHDHRALEVKIDNVEDALDDEARTRRSETEGLWDTVRELQTRLSELELAVGR